MWFEVMLGVLAAYVVIKAWPVLLAIGLAVSALLLIAMAVYALYLWGGAAALIQAAVMLLILTAVVYQLRHSSLTPHPHQ